MTVSTNADAWINQGSPSDNKGDDSILKVMSKSGGDNLRALVNFPMPQMPAGCVVDTATLRIYADSASSGRTLQAFRLASSWSENNVTWNNQPSTTGTAATTTSSSGWREWAVASQVQAMYDTAGHHGFLIRDAVENQDNEQQLFSREKGENPPQLIVTFIALGDLPPDETAPETTLATWPSSTTTSTSASFTFWANEPGATYECSLDTSPFSACSSPAEYTALSVGSHTFAVRATDQAGNVDTTPASYGWTIEEAPPAVDCGAPVTVLAHADAWIDRGSTSSNKGDDSILKVTGKKSNSSTRALVQFTLPTDIPAGCVVESATLRLYAASWKSNRTLQAYRLNGSWTEYGVTWNNQPSTTGSAVTTNSGSGWRQWNVAAQVQAMIDTGVNNGFLIRDANESGNGAEQQFHSREKGENTPQLIITFAPGG